MLKNFSSNCYPFYGGGGEGSEEGEITILGTEAREARDTTSSNTSTTSVKKSSGISQQSPAVQRGVLKYTGTLYLFGLFAHLGIWYLVFFV